MSGKPHILFVQSSADLYGSDRCLISIASGLSKKGYKISVVVPYYGDLIKPLESAGIRTWVLEPVVFRKQILRKPRKVAGLVFETPRSVRELARLIRSEHVDVIHSNTGVVIGGALAAKKCNLPHIWHIREIFSEFDKAWRFYELLIGHYSTRILCISDAVRNQFRASSTKNKLDVIYDGLDIPALREEQLENVKNKEHNHPFRIICVGRINPPFKGQDVLVGAMRRLLDRGIEAELILLGDVFPGRELYKEGLIDQIRSMHLENSVTLAGFQDEINPWIDNADLVIVPSRHKEPFGIVVLEALARGKPVVASKTGGIPEIINDGQNGILVPPGDEYALSEAILKLYQDPELRSKLGYAGWQTVTKKFVLEKTVEDLARIYDQILSPGN